VAITDRYRGPADLPPSIPVFPLAGAILLPRTLLPLNIFEPRYLRMIDDVMADARVIGIIQPAEIEAGVESPKQRSTPLRRAGCAGRITLYHELDDGRRVVTLSGVARFETKSELVCDKPYRVVVPSYERFIGDFAAGTGEEEVNRAKLLRVLRTYLDANRLTADWDAIDRAPSEYLVNTLAVMSPFGPEEKQALLEAADLKARAETLVALAEMELAANAGVPGTLQ
jgi:Lon protease-like protein